MIFLFFGHPGAGKTTLVRRFADLHGITGIDTDHFMTAEEREAVETGRYTQAMRLANIDRYAAHVLEERLGPHVALADGLPNNAARRYALERFSTGRAVLVLVETERSLWERRLAGRSENPVQVGVAEADAYVLANWEPVDPGLPHESVVNGDDDAALDTRLREIYRRYV